MPVNEFGQPVGDDVVGWSARPFPQPARLGGRFVRLDPLGDAHIDQLFAALCGPANDGRWTYMPVGPFADRQAYAAYARGLIDDPGVVPLAILDAADGRAVGVATYMRIDPPGGSIEVGSIIYGPQLAATAGATEAMYLMARYAIDELGYRRYEWKCDALNEPSRRAAARLGFRFEGIFRQATVTKGRNRDTAWLAITDAEWAELRPGFERWLDPANFDPSGRQLRPLAACMGAVHDQD